MGVSAHLAPFQVRLINPKRNYSCSSGLFLTFFCLAVRSLNIPAHNDCYGKLYLVVTTARIGAIFPQLEVGVEGMMNSSK